MKNRLIVKYSTLGGLFLALVSGAGCLLAGRSAALAAGVSLSAFLAALPLPYLLAVPLVRRRALSRARESGIAVLNDAALALFAEVDTLVLAKNGVITNGCPYIREIAPEGTSQSSLLALAASAERSAAHPIGRALYEAAIARRCRLQTASALAEIPGRGAEALIARTPVRVGHADWLIEEGVAISASLLARGDKMADAGLTPVFVSYGRSCRGIIAMADDIPDEIAPSLHRLQRRGLSVHLLTGEGARTTAAIKKQLGLNGARHSLTPGGKAREVQLLLAHGHTVAMLGAGTRDDAALEAADVRILLVRGKDAECASAHHDIRLEDGRMEGLIPLHAISRRFASLTRENRILAVLAWILLLPAATGLFHTLGAPLLSPALTFLAVLSVSLLIVLNSLRA